MRGWILQVRILSRAPTNFGVFVDEYLDCLRRIVLNLSSKLDEVIEDKDSAYRDYQKACARVDHVDDELCKAEQKLREYEESLKK